MEAIKKNMPSLRFPEFDGEWSEFKLGEIGEIITGKTPSTTDENLWDGDIQFVTPTDIDDNKYQYLTQRKIKRQPRTRVLPIKSIMFTCIASIGKMSLSIHPCVTNQQINSIIPSGNYDNEFVFYALSKIVCFIKSTQKTNTLPIINKTEFSKFKLSLPTHPEQQKIASFLTAVDKKIGQLTRKKELLERYKKGVMKQIFSQQVKFKDDNGNEFPKWEKKSFGEVYSFRSTNSLSREKLNNYGGDVKNIHYGDIHKKFSTLFDITKEDVPYIDSSVSLGNIAINNYCHEGDLVFADASEDLFDVGKCIEIINLNKERVLAGLHTILARPDRYSIAMGFGGYLFNSYEIRRQIMKNAQGSKVSSISPTRLTGIAISIPVIKEQIKIANFLYSIDNKILQLKTCINQVSIWKKGLLQRLFV